MKAPTKWKNLRQQLKDLGAVIQSIKGSHEVWKLPNGQLFTVICIHLNDHVPPAYVTKLRRALAAA